MPRINATINDDHADQLDAVKQEADRDISDAEATRRIFDRAQEAGKHEQELRSLREDYERELSECEQDHEQDMQQVRDEYEQTVQSLENRTHELRNQLQAANKRDDDITELKAYVNEERSWRSAGLLKRSKWWLVGKND